MLVFLIIYRYLNCMSVYVFQYYKMDPDSYNMYGGVTHAEYCFQVTFVFYGQLHFFLCHLFDIHF